MTMQERTAYPRFKRKLTNEELAEFFTLSDEEWQFVTATARGDAPRFQLALYLKCFQKLGYLPQMGAIPQTIINYIAKQHYHDLQLPVVEVTDATRSTYRQAIHTYLQVRPYGEGGEAVITPIVQQATYTMSDPADLINVAIEQLVLHRFELPAFSTLNNLVSHIRTQTHFTLYQQATEGLSPEESATLDALLERPSNVTRYPVTRLKALPAKASLKHIRTWEKHLAWLEGILNPNPHLTRLTQTKIEQFATQGYQMEVGDLLDIQSPRHRRTLLLCLLQQMQVRARDQLTMMYLKRINLMHVSGKKKLRKLREAYETMTDDMVNTFAEIVVSTEQTQIDQEDDKDEGVQQQQDAQLGQKVRQIIRKNGGITHFKNNYELLSALQNNNYLPLLQPYYRRHRSTFFRLTQQLSIRTTVQSKGLLQAFDFIQEKRNSHAEYLPDEIGLSFATPRWRKLIRRKENGEMKLHKGHLEACIFSVIGDGLSNGDLYITGSEQFADYRTQLLSWEACNPLLKDYCEAVQLPTTSTEFITQLREQMQQMIEQVDETYTENDTFYFDQNSKPHLRQLPKRTVPDNAEELQDEMQSRMPERHLLDILHHVHQWVPYTRHFTPPSGSDPKLQDPATSYQLTIFSYGSNMGPTQTARHLRGPVTARVIARLNKQHVTTPKLDTANGDIINQYVRFNLPRQWGSQHVAVADGTHYELYENNLMGERHIRYGAYGGIAYHHISDTYVALFSHFIACGVWEAVYILDGLLKNKSVLQPDTVHADTQGQSEAVFGLAHLLGIQLMPRMRNWNKVIMYRPDSNATYQNIGSWFSRTIDWDLLADHWEYLMQVTLSIHKGKVLPSWLLQKLNSDNPKNKLYLALRELGRVHRTLFLLQYVSKPQLRRQIQAATTKIEAYNLFSQWIFFGGDSIMKSRDPVEYEKRIKYKDLIANAIMLHNVVDMTDVLHEMAREGYPVTPEVVATFSPYITEHIKRFGEYVIDTDSMPPPLQPDKPFLARDVLE